MEHDEDVAWPPWVLDTGRMFRMLPPEGRPACAARIIRATKAPRLDGLLRKLGRGSESWGIFGSLLPLSPRGSCPCPVTGALLGLPLLPCPR